MQENVFNMEKHFNINPIKVNKKAILDLEKGKLPPQALDLEEAILGAILIDTKAIDEVVEILSPDVFYKEAHKLIYQSVEELFNSTPPKPIDLLTVSAQLKKNSTLENAGGDYYLIQLTQKIASSAHIVYHSRIVFQKFIQRTCIKVSSDIILESYSEDYDVFDLLEKAYKELGSITDMVSIGKVSDFKKNVLSYFEEKK